MRKAAIYLNFQGNATDAVVCVSTRYYVPSAGSSKMLGPSLFQRPLRSRSALAE